jgi:hypothetical protein
MVQNRSEKNSAKIFMEKDLLDKLPPDIKKEFMKYAIKLGEKKNKQKSTTIFYPLSNTSGQNLLKANTTKKLLTNLINLQKVKLKD